MGNNFSSIPSLPRGNPSRAPRAHPQNLKGKAPPGPGSAGGLGCRWRGRERWRGVVGEAGQVPPVVRLWRREMHLWPLGVRWRWGAAGDDGENQEGWRPVGSTQFSQLHQKRHWSPLRPRCKASAPGEEGHLPGGWGSVARCSGRSAVLPKRSTAVSFFICPWLER